MQQQYHVVPMLTGYHGIGLGVDEQAGPRMGRCMGGAWMHGGGEESACLNDTAAVQSE